MHIILILFLMLVALAIWPSRVGRFLTGTVMFICTAVMWGIGAYGGYALYYVGYDPDWRTLAIVVVAFIAVGIVAAALHNLSKGKRREAVKALSTMLFIPIDIWLIQSGNGKVLVLFPLLGLVAFVAYWIFILGRAVLTDKTPWDPPPTPEQLAEKQRQAEWKETQKRWKADTKARTELDAAIRSEVHSRYPGHGLLHSLWWKANANIFSA